MIERLTLTLTPTLTLPLPLPLPLTLPLPQTLTPTLTLTLPLPRCGTKIEMLRVYETIYSLSAWLKLDCALTMVTL